MKTRVILQTNTGFRVDRNELEGETVVAMAFTDKNEVMTDARLATIGRLNKRFITNFAIAVTSVLEKAVGDNPGEEAAYIELFEKALSTQIKRMREKNAKREENKRDLDKARDALFQTLKESGLDEKATAEVIETIEKIAGGLADRTIKITKE